MAGARAVNCVEVQALDVAGDRVAGVRPRDRVGGDEFDIRARVRASQRGSLARTGGAPQRSWSRCEPALLPRASYFTDLAMMCQPKPRTKGRGMMLKAPTKQLL